jgi:ribosomal-protein-alanine N-acetyltransferase
MPPEEVILSTVRLELRRWNSTDRAALFEILGDAEVMRFVAKGRPFTKAETDQFIAVAEIFERENGFARWKVIEDASGDIVGSCGFGRIATTGEIEFGYIFARRVWNIGYATEIGRAVVEYGFKKLGFREIIALTAMANINSQRVLVKLGFSKRGVESIDGDLSLVFVKSNPDA